MLGVLVLDSFFAIPGGTHVIFGDGFAATCASIRADTYAVRKDGFCTTSVDNCVGKHESGEPSLGRSRGVDDISYVEPQDSCKALGFVYIANSDPTVQS
jgi:hypothetical protein